MCILASSLGRKGPSVRSLNAARMALLRAFQVSSLQCSGEESQAESPHAGSERGLDVRWYLRLDLFRSSKSPMEFSVLARARRAVGRCVSCGPAVTAYECLCMDLPRHLGC